MLMQSTLQGEPVARFMRADPVAIEPSLDLQHLVDDYIYRYHYRMFPVVEDGQLRGCVNVSRLKQLDRSQWPQHRVAEIMQPCSPQNTVTPQTGAMEALNLMTESGNRRLLVADQGRLVAIITLRDLIEFLALKLKLEAPA
jgi:predicted transcriptional regulator